MNSFGRWNRVTDETVAPRPQAEQALEIDSLARLMTAASAHMERFYRRPERGLAESDADAMAWEAPSDDELDRMINGPADQATWWALNLLQRRDPHAALSVWGQIRDAARAELDSGHRAAGTRDTQSSPWDRAQFLAIRAAFREEWSSRGGIEDSLLDAAALAYGQFLQWMTTHALLIELPCEEGGGEQSPRRRPVRLGAAAERQVAMDMADRFHRMFLRTLRALSDLRRRPAVLVQNAGQVNVAANQVNTVRDP